MNSYQDGGTSGSAAGSDQRFIVAIVTAQFLAQIGAFTLPALLPGYMARWSLSATEAGSLIGAFFIAYVATVPILVGLTDRMPARRIYMTGAGLTALSHLGFATVADGFWSALALRAIAGVGWAGCYMPGLKAIADRLTGSAQSRAVSWHAAGVGVSGAASFAVAGAIDAASGPRAAFLAGAAAAAIACVIAAITMLKTPPRRAGSAPPGGLLDFRPVLRNRAAMAWIAGYTVHTLELAALRAWGVTFLASVIARHGAPDWLPSTSVLFTGAGLLGIVTSLSGNEAAIRLGRGRIVALAMGSSAMLALVTGLSALVSTPVAIFCVYAWNAAIYIDSSALTAGTVQAAEPARRGATMGLHSMCGYAGGFVGPLGVGMILDLVGAETAAGWVLAFGYIVPVTLGGLYVLRRLGQ